MYVILSDGVIFKNSILIIRKLPILIHSQRYGPQKRNFFPNGGYIFNT